MMHIRRARESEASILTAVAIESKLHWEYGQQDMERWHSQLRVTPDGIVSNPTFVADVDGHTAGFYQLAHTAREWALEHLWVSPPYMRRGIGRALLTHAAATARKGGATSITVDADPNAEPFYLACGALREGVVAAPIANDPKRIRPQLRLSIAAGIGNAPPRSHTITPAANRHPK